VPARLRRRDLLLAAPAGAAAQRSPQSETARASLPLEPLRDAYRRDLFDDFLPFMDKYVIDHRYGGFMCNTDRDGTRLSTQKTAWYEGRGIWVYSFLYNYLAREAKYLEVARRSVEFILKSRPEAPDGLWPKTFHQDGTPSSPPDTAIYGDLFIAEGLAEFAKAAGEPPYWDLAREIVLKCVRIYDRPDYEPRIGETYLGPGARPFPGARIQGVWMVLIRVISQMLEARADPELERILSRSVSAVIDHHFNPAFDLTNELLNHDLSRPENEYAQLVYTGHAIETLWMILYEAVRRRDRGLFNTAAARFRRHVEVAWDDVYGGVFRNLQHVDQNLWSVDKVLWAQEEVLIGSLCVFEHTGEAWARDWFLRMYDYVQAHYPLRRYGFPLWITAADRKVTFERHATRVENYHHPRHLMLNLLALERLIGRGGRPSEVFGAA
jgi:N-acylglucosamine 2-epimerase